MSRIQLAPRIAANGVWHIEMAVSMDVSTFRGPVMRA
jgi:hypothetical protein